MNILAVDDDELFLYSYETIFDGQGHTLLTASTVPAAIGLLQQNAVDLVLLDQNLLGPDGGPVGLELVDTIRTYSPAAVIFVISGVPDLYIERAFAFGVDDFLLKNQHLRAMLRAKVALVSRLLQARRQATRSSVDREAATQATWRHLQDETDSGRKGKLLEDLIVDLFADLPGVREAVARTKTEIEEIDVAIETDGTGIWSAFATTPLVLVECKKWNATVGREELDILVGKMRRRHGRSRLGLFVAWSGVSKPFEKLATLEQDHLVVILDRARLRQLLETQAKDRAELLAKWISLASLDVHR